MNILGKITKVKIFSEILLKLYFMELNGNVEAVAVEKIIIRYY